MTARCGFPVPVVGVDPVWAHAWTHLGRHLVQAEGSQTAMMVAEANVATSCAEGSARQTNGRWAGPLDGRPIRRVRCSGCRAAVGRSGPPRP